MSIDLERTQIADFSSPTPQTRPTRRSRRWMLLVSLIAVASLSMFCSEESPPNPLPPEEAKAETIAPTNLRVNRIELENTSLNGQLGVGYADLYGGMAHGGQDATDNASLLDFRYQYRGRDIANQRSFENLGTKTRWDRTGLFTNATPTNSRITGTRLNEADFDSIDNRDDLIASFNFQPLIDESSNRYRRAYLSNAADEPLFAVFAFIDKSGKRGLFKVVQAERAPLDTVSEGTLTIEIKVEDPGAT